VYLLPFCLPFILAYCACSSSDSTYAPHASRERAQQHPFAEIREVFSSKKSVELVRDETGLLSSYDFEKLNECLKWIFVESDIDARVLLLKGTGGVSIEDLAARQFKEMHIGGRSHDARGLLMLYDFGGKRLRLEVGYGLEGIITDAFVGYLTREHMKAFFQSKKIGIGVNFTLRILQQRIREAVLGNDFDPRVLQSLPKSAELSGGAGATTKLSPEDLKSGFINVRSNGAESQLYGAAPSVSEAYRRYLLWMAQPDFNPEADLFTAGSRRYMSRLPMSRGYFDYILLSESGRTYKFVERDELALLFFTNTPLVCPHFFRKSDAGWQMDIEAEIHNTVNRVGGIYAWDLRIDRDPYIDRFADLLIHIKGYNRLIGGDNRPLVIRGSSLDD
jgi:hypothetical protein